MPAPTSKTVFPASGIPGDLVLSATRGPLIKRGILSYTPPVVWGSSFDVLCLMCHLESAGAHQSF
jgi:hypothetical protein